MWIVLGIVGFLALLITVILLLPVKVIIKSDENNELYLRYKFLGKTYGEDPDPNDPIVLMLKKAGGVTRLEKKNLQASVKSGGLQKTVTDSFQLIIDLLKEVLGLLQYATARRLHVKIRCGGEDAAETAIHYGQYCAIAHGFLNVLQGFVKIRKRGCKIDIGCDFFGEDAFAYDILLVVRFNHVLAGFWRAVVAEAKRMAKRPPQQK